MGIFMIFINRPFQENKNTLFNKNISLLVEFGLWDCLDRTYFTETENWKYYSKIIFKCMNSTVGPNFKVVFSEKSICESCEQCTGPTEKQHKCANAQRRHYLNST